MPSSAPQIRHNPPPSRTDPPSTRSRMPSLFNTIRACIYGTVFLFTLICLAMAGHFQSVLAASDLTRFVPFAIFVCSASILIIVVLLGCSFFLRERNPISTRLELACLALLGIFWLVLGAYLAASESQSADVECFSSATAVEPLDDSAASFHTDQYQAMYRVLMTFALMNAVLLLLSCLILLLLAIRRHNKGDEHMWHGPVTSCAWFNDYGNAKPKRSKSNGSSILPLNGGGGGRGGYSSDKQAGYPSGRRQAGYSEKLYPASSPAKVAQGTPPRPPPKQYSPRQGSGDTSLNYSSNDDFESGAIVNPNLAAQRGRR